MFGMWFHFHAITSAVTARAEYRMLKSPANAIANLARRVLRAESLGRFPVSRQVCRDEFGNDTTYHRGSVTKLKKAYHNVCL